MSDKDKEVIVNGETTGGQDNSGGGDQGGQPVTGGQPSSGESGGSSPSSTGSESSSGGQGGDTGGSSPSNTGSEPSRAERKAGILDSIRGRQSKDPADSTASKSGAARSNPRNSSKAARGGSRKPQSDSGANAGRDRTAGQPSSGIGESNGSPSDSASSTEQDRVKPTGLEITGLPKNLGKAAQGRKPTAFELDAVFTKKDAEAMQPRLEKALKTVFKHMDKGITATNTDGAESKIWRQIDSEEIEVIASYLVELGQKSRVTATVVRKVTQSHRLLEIGVITVPRFVASIQFYGQHGGFALPEWLQPILGGMFGGKMFRAKNQRSQVSGGEVSNRAANQ